MKLPVVGCGDVGEVGGVGKILDASPRINNEISKSIEPFFVVPNGVPNRGNR